MTKVILIGGGAIANKLLQNAPKNVIFSQYGIRNLQQNPEKWFELTKEAVVADVVIYLAYHKQNILSNFSILSRLLNDLSKKKWKGRFVFFNTQLALPSTAFSGEHALPGWLHWDTYSFTKRVQSLILRFKKKKVLVSEFFLPIVIGDNTQWSERLSFIANHSIINLPYTGNAKCAWLDINILSRWFWLIGLKSENSEQIFLYGETGPFKNLLKAISQKSDGDISAIKDFKHRFRFSSNWKIHCLTTLKHSPIAVLITFASQLVSRIKKQKNMMAETEVKIVHCHSDIFTPDGSEYQFFAQTLNIDLLPYETKKIV